ncbi:hypothetical protein TRVL_01379 [Trypanosoma vivax]|nr:hypothetical protein TRVL_01379 [Trypanosoma vivax]
MLAFIGSACTLASTFMAADSLNHTLGVNRFRTGRFMLVVWIIAVCFSRWWTTIEVLGWLHCLIFVGAGVSFGEAGLSHDFIRIPLSTFVPAFGIINILCNYT